MTAPTRGDGNDAVDVRLERLLGVADIDDVVKAQATISVNRVSHLPRDPDRGDQDGNLIFDGQRDILGQPRIGLVN